MAIGYFKCGNISCSRFAGIDQANASPCKRCTSELDRQHVADHTRKTAIAVRERMDGNEPVAESDGNFIGWVGSMLDPISRVVDQLTKVHGDSVSIDADVARRGAILTSPTPHVSEHTIVKMVQEILVENITLTARQQA